MSEPRTIPLTPVQQRDVQNLLTQMQTVQDRLNIIVRTVIAGTDLDPDTLQGYSIDPSQPSRGIVITPPNGG